MRTAEDKGMRILLVTARPPWPPRRGDQARTAGLLRHLAGRHSLHLLALCPPGFAPAPPDTPVGATLVTTGLASHAAATLVHLDRPLQVAMHTVPGLTRELRRQLELVHPEVVMLVLSRLAGLLAELRDIPVVVDFVDSLALNMKMRARRQRLLAPFFHFEARRMAAWDRAVLTQVARGVVVSRRDRDALVGPAPTLAPRLAVVPFGVPVPEAPPASRPVEGRVLLSGNLGYFPTVDGARWFGREVWPRLSRSVPTCSWWLVGARPAASVRRLARLPGVVLVADPPDLAPHLAAAAVAVAPLHAGSGTPIKVLEAMAAGVPVVTTPLAAAGLDEVPAEALAVADDGASFADAVTRLLADPRAARRQVLAAWEWVRATHALEVTGRAFETVLEEAAAS